jgi:16S rRNA processing protein RimM
LKKNDRLSSLRQISLGRIVSIHGVRGVLRVLPYARPCLTLQKGLEVFLQKDRGAIRRSIVEAVRPAGRLLLVKLQGIESRSQAEEWRDAVVLVEELRLPPLQEGEFYYYQVEGLRVVTTAGEYVGTIAGSFFSGGHDVWVVRHGEREYLLPVVDEVVRVLDCAGGQAIIEPIPGLLE